jgi:hypothetical protein
MSDELEMVYVWHEGLDAYAWIPKSALRQHGLQGWITAEPPPPPEPEPEPVKSTRRARGTEKKE